MANPMTPGPLYQGGADLVGALLGGGQAQERARQSEQMRLLQEQSAEATIDKKITDAYLARDQRNAQQNYANNFAATGVDPLQAALMGDAMIGGNANLEQAQRFGMRAQVPAAMEADGVSAGNALVMALGNKLNPGVVDVAGQNVTGMYGDSPAITDSNETLSKIVENAAQANASNARAGVSDAQAAHGGYAPRAATAPRQEKPGNYTLPSATNMAATLPTIMVGEGPSAREVVDPDAKREFVAWQAAQADIDPKYRDGDFALAMHAIQKPAVRLRDNGVTLMPGTAPVRLPADVPESAMMVLMDMNRERGAAGLPPLSRDEQIRAVSEIMGTGATSDPLGAIAPRNNDSAPNAVPVANKRVAGQTYPTPRGPMRWTGTGWVAP